MRFNRLVHQFWQACCCGSPIDTITCTQCDASTGAQFFQLTISGSVTANGCFWCAEFVDDWVVDFVSEGAGTCSWDIDAGCICDHASLRTTIIFSISYASGTNQTTLQAQVTVAAETIVFEKVLTGKLNCTDISETLTYKSGGSTNCNGWSGATVAVSISASGPVSDSLDDCESCEHTTTPATLQAVYANITDNGTCVQCANSGEMTVECSKDDCCEWSGTHVPGFCSSSFDTVITLADGVMTVDVTEQTSGKTVLNASYDFGAVVDCSTINQSSGWTINSSDNSGMCGNWDNVNLTVQAL